MHCVMELVEIKEKLPEDLFLALEKEITTLRPAQEKAIQAGLLEGKNLLVCTPTASGKTLIAELALVKHIMENSGKGIYIVPLRALAVEKYKAFKEKYKGLLRIALAIGELDSSESRLEDYDLIICTSEKIDSVLRHRASWINSLACVVVDEIHLLNDISRGPTLEVVITILRKLVPKIQLIGLSATIGNPLNLAKWLDAELVVDTWRPVVLKEGVYFQGETTFSNRG